MAQCKDCIHNGLCKIYSDFIRNHDCELFVGKADVVPKSEVEKAKQEVAREIFEEIDSNFYYDDVGDYVIDHMDYQELKKKYTEVEHND